MQKDQGKNQITFLTLQLRHVYLKKINISWLLFVIELEPFLAAGAEEAR